jgi:outer membrane protein OmpA-like peptidoglycan-associated protein
VALYGIYFDSAKAEVKPESQPALTEIAKLLGSNPKLKLHVVGHTDSTGEVAKNIELSRARAKAVALALTTKYSVPAWRLRAEGVGPLSPVASNADEGGRAKNRRVELVEQ